MKYVCLFVCLFVWLCLWKRCSCCYCERRQSRRQQLQAEEHSRTRLGRGIAVHRGAPQRHWEPAACGVPHHPAGARLDVRHTRATAANRPLAGFCFAALTKDPHGRRVQCRREGQVCGVHSTVSRSHPSWTRTSAPDSPVHTTARPQCRH